MSNRVDKSDRAIVAVGFGVGDIQVKARCIDTLLADLQSAFGTEYDVFEAWTSSFLMKKMAKEGHVFHTLAEVLADLTTRGYTDVVVMPTHLTPGEEWQKKIQPVLDEYAGRFQSLGFMEPVLAAASPESFAPIGRDIEAVLQLEELAEGEELVLMGNKTVTKNLNKSV